jgi:DTW domain-containing protein YfiP
MKKPPFDIVVLRHWREKNRDTNSGQLVTDCIAGARVVDMVDESYKNLAAHLPKGNVWLLFPESIDSAGNVVVPTHRGLPDPLPKTIVVVDGTWAEAQRMAKALPGLPRLVPQGGPRASERLLAPPQAGAMATAEAIAALIAQVDPHAAACLDRAYARHVASLKKSNPYKAAIPIVSGIAYYPNPKKVLDVPIEATVRSERIGTKTRELTPGVHVVAQISRTGKEVWLTHGEQRLFLYLQDDQGRGSLFYQSFAGTGGKAQGFWFPSGGILADQRGGGVWVIKGNPKTDPGAGREGLLALYEKANAVLPQSDAETDAFVKKVTRVDYDDLMYKDEYEIQPTMKILEEGHANALQSKWNNWAYRFWALNALDKTWGKRTFNIKENPTDLVGRHIPDRYLAGLPAALQKQRIGELTESRDAYKRGDYSELPTDVTARKMGLVKQSNYTTEAKKRGVEWRGDAEDMAGRVLQVYSGRAPANEVQQFAEALRASFAKGLAAWKSGGHRPGATAQNWAVARVNSLVVGGKTSWTADKKLFEVLPAAVRAKIESMRQKQNPISVEVRLDGGYPAGYGEAVAGKHTRYLQSEAALTRIVEQGKEVVPRIKFVVDWDKNAAAKRPSIAKGERGVITLIASAATLQGRADDADSRNRTRPGGPVSRDRKVSLYTAHTILHRLGDRIMPRPEDVMFMSLDSPGFVDRRAALVVTARVENAWRLLGEALAVAWNHTGGNDGLNRWLPTVVDTKACREGWVIDGQQAMAELVPYRLLYKKGREQGVKLMSDLPFVPRLEKAFTDYIDACIDQFTGQEVLI